MRHHQHLELFGANDPAIAMKTYIKEHFSDLLGPHVALLDQPGGLDTLASMMRSGSLTRNSKG
jgi:hypothetical protein